MAEIATIEPRNTILAPFTPDADTRREKEAWAALAPSSRRRYRGALRRLSTWSAQQGDGVESDAALLADYLQAEADGGRIGGLHIVVAALTFWQRARGLPVTADDPLVRLSLRRLKRQAPPPRQAAALGDHELDAIRSVALEPRSGRFGRMEDRLAAQLRGTTDIALAQVMSDAGLRRSEAGRLVWDDLEEWEDGSGRLRIAPSKGAAEETVVYVTPTAIAALRDLRMMQETLEPRADRRIFRLQPAQIARRIKRVCADAGLLGAFSGHSGRVGMARRMARAGAPMVTMMRQGRWRSASMPARYTRNEAAGEAGRWLR